jgi:hypothetical protein
VTRPHRRDKDIKNASVIAGLRMEPDLARVLTAYALDHMEQDRDGRVDVGLVTRYLLRIGLGWSAGNASDMGVHRTSTAVPGLRVEPALLKRIEKARDNRGHAGRAAAIRHILRMQLGFTEEASLAREDNFERIAAARREMAEATRAALALAPEGDR